MQRTIVEIVEVDPGAKPGPAVPNSVRINGTDVGLIAADSLSVEIGDISDPRTVTSVTLTLLPDEIRIGKSTS